MQPVVVNEGPPPWKRWLALPAALLIVVLVALAADAEPRQNYVDSQEHRRMEQTRFEAENAERLIFYTKEGEVVELSLDGNDISAKDANGGIERLLVDRDGQQWSSGYTINEDGTFSRIGPGQNTDGETIIVPNDVGGFTLVQPDGSEQTMLMGPEGLQVLNSDGTMGELERDSDGRLVFGDDLRGRESQAEVEYVDRSSPTQTDGGGGGLGLRTVLLVVLALVALAGAAWWFVAMRPKYRLAEAPAPFQALGGAPESMSDWETFEAYLGTLRANPDAAQAIREAYGYAAQGMGRLVPRHVEQTPLEWCAVVAETQPDLGPTLQALTNRFSSIRFGDEAATNVQRERAIDELGRLVRGACS